MSHKKFQQANAPFCGCQDFFGMVFFIGSPVAFCKREVAADELRVFRACIGIVAQSLGSCECNVTHAPGF